MGRFVEEKELLRLSLRQFEGEHILSVYCPLRDSRDLREAVRNLEEFLKKHHGSDSLEKNVREVIRYLSHYTPEGTKKGLAIFANVVHGFFEVYELPQPWKHTVVYGPFPYTRPLAAIFDEYPRIFLVLADRREARFFEIYMGEIREHESFSSEVPSRIRAGGWYGLEERRIARSIEQKVVHHFQDIADILVDHFRRLHFDALFVGLREEEYVLFERVLPSYLRGKLKGKVALGPKSDLAEIRALALQLEGMVREEEDRALVDRLLAMVGNADLATIGLASVLRAASFGACQAVVVEEGYRELGFLCSSCGMMALFPGTCELCGGEKRAVEDIVEELLEVVILQRGEVKYLFARDFLVSPVQHIGAFLRFQI